MQILQDIINWIEDKPKFWQVAIEKLIRNNQLTDSDLSNLKEICKAENGLSVFEYNDVDFDSLREYANNSSSTRNVTLTKILNVENINALTGKNFLEFNPQGLTVIYGDNGSGKSSYVSILKHICNTRGQKPPINDNLYDPDCRGKDKKAEVEYTFDGNNFQSVELKNNDVSDSTLKNVDVFDSFSANHYIAGEDEIAFIPQGLSIVEKFATCLKQIESNLDNEIQTLNLSKFNFATLQIDENTNAKTFLSKLNSETTLNELRGQSQYSVVKADRIIKLKEIIFKLKATDPKSKLKNNEEKINRFNILKSKFETLESSLVGESLEYNQQIFNNYIINAETLKATSDKAFSDLPIKEIGNDSWKQLWESARKFYNESVRNESFPNTDESSTCPLCLQELNVDAKQRFVNFEEFVKQDVQQEYDKALRKYKDILSKLNGLSFNFTDQEPIIKELEEIYPDFTEHQKSYIEVLSNQRDSLIIRLSDLRILDDLLSPKLEKSTKLLIEDIIKGLMFENAKLKVQTIEEDLKPLERELLELKYEKIIYNFKPKIAREIFRQKKIKLLNQCVSKCNTRTITTLSNHLTITYVTQSLQHSFKEELDKLGFRNINIETETKGVRGKQYHFLRLNEANANNINLKDILSEGEHRCIALATFLSELSISEHKSAIIFDDPVCSLDHKWRNRIAKRIVEESNNRQVIVFTHDITFLLMIQENSEILESELHIKSLTRRKFETGIIANNPPWDALPVGKRIGIMKSDHQIIEKVERTETEEIYKERIKLLYGKLRETWERFVEEVFLNGTIQRFGREIQTQRLKKIVDLTIEDYNYVDENMSKCSTYFWGHDSSGTLIEEMPDSSEFLADIKILETYSKAIKDRRK